MRSEQASPHPAFLRRLARLNCSADTKVTAFSSGAPEVISSSLPSLALCRAGQRLSLPCPSPYRASRACRAPVSAGLAFEACLPASSSVSCVFREWPSTSSSRQSFCWQFPVPGSQNGLAWESVDRGIAEQRPNRLERRLSSLP